MKGYPRNFRNFVYLVIAMLTLTGLAITPSALEMRMEWEVSWGLSGDSRVAVHALHAIAALLTLFIIGALWVIHIRAGWKRRNHHHSGITMLLLIAALCISGIGLYYAGEESLGRLSVIAHLLTGPVLPLIFIAHIVSVRRRAQGVLRDTRQASGGETGTCLAWNRES
ncbi:MAG TPA: hypothetical protein VGE50_11295 [Gammaproteobacteria bacterium]